MLKIKRQMSRTNHPINRIIKIFQDSLCKKYMEHLHKDEEGEYKAVFKEVLRQMHCFIDMVVSAMISFYELDLKRTDMKRSLIVNLVTNQVIKDEVYFIVVNFYSFNNYKEISLIADTINNPDFYNDKLSLEALKVKP
mmetsp:Transcript_38751/g.37095  ORF Transcript_38751/g.37095 Transcript_38751/m.37095 type:complete len:138 (-) Transcript_38751:890-1303(-)